MTTLSEVVTARANGVYRFAGDAAVALRTLPHPPRHVRIRAPRDKAAILQACASALRFPGWFGHNWDALEECLLDLPLAGTPGLVIEMEGLSALARAEPETLRDAIAVFTDVAQAWQGRDGLLVVLLEGTGPVAQDLPELALDR